MVGITFRTCFHLMNYKTLTANQNPRNLTSSFVNKPNAMVPGVNGT